MQRALLVAAVPLLSGCGTWFFSGTQWVDHSHPVALVETTGGIECGATTEFGVLTLGRSAASGPCRVHYFLGPTPIVESGELEPAGSLWTRARIDLRTQHLRALDRAPNASDRLIVMWTLDGRTTQRTAVQLAEGDDVRGDVLRDPGVALPAGATVLCEKDDDDGWLFAGLIAGAAVREDTGERFYVYAGVDRIRELLAMPTTHPQDTQPKYRPDDITVQQPVTPTAPPTTQSAANAQSLQQLFEAALKAQKGQPIAPGQPVSPPTPAPTTPTQNGGATQPPR